MQVSRGTARSRASPFQRGPTLPYVKEHREELLAEGEGIRRRAKEALEKKTPRVVPYTNREWLEWSGVEASASMTS